MPDRVKVMTEFTGFLFVESLSRASHCICVRRQSKCTVLMTMTNLCIPVCRRCHVLVRSPKTDLKRVVVSTLPGWPHRPPGIFYARSRFGLAALRAAEVWIESFV